MFRGNNRNPGRGRGGSNKRKRERDEFDDNPTKRAHKLVEQQYLITKAKQQFKEDMGESYIISIFKKNLEEMNATDYAMIRAKLTEFQIDQGIDINVTKILELPSERKLMIRVHSVDERLTIHQLVTRIDPYYTTYCPLDINNKINIRMFLPNNFPQHLIKPRTINKTYIGKTI